MMKLKKLLSFILALAIIFTTMPAISLPADAATTASGTTGDCTWSLRGTELTISGNGKIGDYTSNYMPWGTSITSLIIENGVTYIGKYSFYNCSNLVNISISDTVQEIGYSAFSNCSSLKKVNLPDSVTSINDYAFYNCANMTDLIIGDGITYFGRHVFENNNKLNYTTYNNGKYLGNSDNPYVVLVNIVSKNVGSFDILDTTNVILDSAFKNCSNLTDVVIPENIRYIGYGAFSGCNNLKSMTLPFVGFKTKGSTQNSNTANLSYPFGYIFGTESYDFTCSTQYYYEYLSDGSSYIRNSANFAIPPSLKTVTITGGEIVNEDFYNCYNLTDVIIGDKVTKIGYQAFYYCSNIKNITIGSGVIEIGNSAFTNCSSLTSIVIPDNVKIIGSDILNGCEMLNTLTVPFIGKTKKTSSDTYQYPLGYFFGTKTFTASTATEQSYHDYSTINTTRKTFYIPSRLRNVTVTGGEILTGAFENCIYITNVTLGNGVTKICGSAFYKCTNLSKITIPNSVTDISASAFYQCPNLGYNIYGNAKYLGNDSQPYLFLSKATSTSITSCQIHETTKAIFGYAFSGCNNLSTITIPDNVYHIGNDAFENCVQLKSVSLSKNLKEVSSNLFENCSNLTSVSIPASVTEIGSNAFLNCSSLSSMIIPENIIAVGNDTFKGCEKLKFNTYSNGKYLGNSTNPYRVMVDTTSTDITSCTINSNTKIISSAFVDCNNLTELKIPTSVIYIASSSLSGCSSLKSLSIPFVGERNKKITDDFQYPFGRIFGGSFTSSYSAKQTYKGKNSEETASTYFIPSSLLNVTVTGGEIVDGAFENCSSITNITISKNTSYIGKAAFKGCNFSEFSIPVGVTIIESDAFNNCSKLNGINIPANVEKIGSNAFQGCVLVPEIILPNSLKTIGASALKNCTSITEITIPDSVTTIGSSVFSGCYNLSSIKVPFIGNTTDNKNKYPLGFFFGTTTYTDSLATTQKYISDISYKTATYYIPSKLKSVTVTGGKLNYGAFYNCEGLKEVILGNNVTNIGQKSFYNCCNLSELVIPNSVITIEKYAFENCSNLDNVVLSETIKSIGDNAFNNCLKIKNLYIPKNVESIGANVFTGCDSLERFSVSVENQNFCSENGILYNKDKTKIIYVPNNLKYRLQINYTYINGAQALPTYIKDFKVGEEYNETVPKIPGYSTNISIISGTMPAEDLSFEVTYYENAELTNGVCNDNISWTLYEDGALVFRGTGAMPDYTSGGAPWASYNTSIKEIYIDSRITSIGNYAFENCSNLTFIDYGYSIKSIGKYAFPGCSSLTSFKLPNTVTTVSEGAFMGCSGLKTVVIPDNITAISDKTFYGCANLTKVTLGGAITSVGNNAFDSCSKLNQIYFRGKPATLGSNALGSVSGKYIYYYSTVKGWNDAVSNGKWNGYFAYPYDLIAKEGFDGTNPYAVKVVDKHNTPLQGAIVKLGGNTASTKNDGLAYFVKPTGSVNLKITCSNHRDFIDEEFKASDTQAMDVIELSDKPSTVQGIRLGSKSIATSVETLNCGEEKTVNITVSGYSKYSIVRYELHQGNRLIATNKTSATSTTFSVKASAFEEGQTVFVEMYTSDGGMVATALNIDVIKLANISESQILSELSNIDISIGLGSMGNYRVPITLQANGQEKFYTSIKDRTIRVGINLDIGEFFGKDEDSQKYKTEIHKMVDKSMRTFKKGKPGMEYNVCGYLEIEYLGNGEYYVKTCYVKLGVAAKLSFNAQASYFGVVGVYFKAELTGEASLDMKITHYTPDSGFEIADLNFAMENTLKLEGGAYLLWGAGSAGIYGKAQMGFVLGLIPDVEF